MTDDHRGALDALRRGAVRDRDLSAVFADLLPVDGASVSTFGTPLGNETVSASNTTASRLDEIQFDLAEGPCWDAVRSGRPVLEPDVLQSAATWPAFAEAVAREPVRGLFAFPVSFGPFRLGAVDLFRTRPGPLDDDDVSGTSALAAAVGRRVLLRALRDLEEDGQADHAPFSRRVVHQATGVVLAQLDVTPEDAALLIQGHAFASQRSVGAVAEDVVAGRIRFARHGDVIEDAAPFPEADEEPAGATRPAADDAAGSAQPGDEVDQGREDDRPEEV